MSDPLPSWNEGPAKRSILDFVARVTKEGGADFVPSADRIATFDNDGTLWCEQPMQVRLFFAFDRLVELAKSIGSSVKSSFEMRAGRAEIIKLAELDSFDDREVKPVNIYLHIGRRPILAFGNSDGNLAMMRYAKTGDRAGLALLLHHDDAEREFAYDREFRLSPLAEALDKASEYGLQVVSMKNDWKTVFEKEG